MTPEQYCRQKAARSGSSFYYSFLFLPPRQRNAIMALYAFCREVDDVVDETHDPSVAFQTLQWWRFEVEQIFHGTPSHPVGKALQTVLPDFHLKEQHFVEIIQGMEMDLTQNRYENYAALETYCYHVASVVGLLSVEIFGYQDPQTLQYAKKLGLALQLTNIIRDVREDIERDRIYFPQDELTQFNISEVSLHALKESPQLTDFLSFQTQRAYQLYDEALACLPKIDRHAQRTGLIMANIYRQTLVEIEADGFQIMSHRVSLTPLRKLWIAWRTARREKAI